MNRLTLFIGLLSSLLPALTMAQSATPPVTAVVVVEGLTWDDVAQGKIGPLYVLARHGAVGLMSVSRVNKDSPLAFALTLQTGRRLGTPKGDAERFVSNLRRQRPKIRWLTAHLAQAGVATEVITHAEALGVKNILSIGAKTTSANHSPSLLRIHWIRGSTSSVSAEINKALIGLNPERDKVVVLGIPTSPQEMRIVPIILAGSGLSSGILTSSTTRTPGLVSDIDLTPTLLRWHDVTTRVGEHPIVVLQDNSAMTTLQALYERLYWNAIWLVPVGALQVIGGALAVLAVVRLTRTKVTTRRTKLLLSVLIVTLLSLPAGTLIAPYLPANAQWQYIGAVLLSAAWLSLISHMGAWEEPLRAYVRACALSVLIILADAISGQQGVRHSLYSAYALSGVRFYGVGNEVMGVLLGCALVWGIYGLRAPWWRALVWMTAAIVLAMPAWGANLGGFLAAAVGLGCAWEAQRIAVSRKLMMFCATWLLVSLAAAVGIMWVDSLSVQPTHVGEVWLRWRGEGWQVVADMFASKLKLTLWVVTHPLAWGAAIVIGAVLWVLSRNAKEMLKRLSERTAGSKVSPLFGWLSTIVAALVFNDSGFVPAAAILSVGIGALISKMLGEVAHGSPE